MRHWFSILLACFIASASIAVEQAKLENPISVDYLQQHLSETHPRLVFTPSILAELKEKLKSDPVLQNRYAAIKLNADRIYDKPLLKRKMVGRRLLGISREMLYRMNMLGLVYLVEQDPKALQRINDEVLTVCAFSDWNPSHFLDVAEMSMAVALALDWTEGDLPEETMTRGKAALIEKGLKPSWPEDGKKWGRAYGNNNWNQVCNGGLISAALTIYEEEPELAANTISRALDGMPNALVEYAPDGVYPEGSTYWGYGTGFSVVTIAMLESALGSDFGISAMPGFMESAMFRSLCTAPSGGYYNFADCGDFRSKSGDTLLAWFAAKTGNRLFFEEERFLLPPENEGKLFRLDGSAMAWLSQYEEQGAAGKPLAWKGEGGNPIVIFTGGEHDPNRYYFGGKGGKATTSHGNMDAGSFVFELDGIRWVIDPGNQNYNALEKTGFNLWSRRQDSERWTLLTKNNFGHSTISVNDELFIADGFAPLIDFKDGDRPQATFDLTEVYGGNLKKATRRFIKDGPTSLLIQDRIATSDETKKIVWQLGTVADVELVEGGAVLTMGARALELQVKSNLKPVMRVVSLDPPPIKLDKQIKGFKRIEIEFMVHGDVNIELDVRLIEN